MTGDELQTLPHNHIVKSVDFSFDEDCLLTGSNDKVIRLYNLGSDDSG